VRIAVAALLITTAVAGCASERGALGEFGIGRDGNTLLIQPGPMRAALRLARAVATDGERPAALEVLCSFEGRRVFLTAYEAGRVRRVSTGKGADLCESVVQAATDHRGQVSGARLKLDIATEAEAAGFKLERLRTAWHDVGLVGFWVNARDQQSAAFVVPSEIVERGLQARIGRRADVHGIRRVLEGRVPGGDSRIPDGVPMIRFRTESWLEVGDDVVRLYRTHAWDRPQITPDLLYARIVAAADYLERVNDVEGRFVYGLDPAKGQTSRSYNMVRHAGAAYGLMQAYVRTGDRRYVRAGRRALEFIARHVRERPLDDGPTVAHVVYDRYSKLGGQGLALAAFAAYTEFTGDRRYLLQMRGIAGHILTQIHADGDVTHYFDWGPEARTSDTPVLFYPGEAMVGLLGLNRVEPDERWVEAAELMERFIIEERDAGLELNQLQHDQWQMIALSELHRISSDDRYRVQALRIARAIQLQQRTAENPTVASGYIDYLGSFYDPPDVTHVAARMEGLLAAIEIARRAGSDEESWLMPMVQNGVGFSLQLQYVEPRLYFLSMPTLGHGAFPEGIHDTFVRIDYAWHNLSALIGLERLLREQPGSGNSAPAADPIPSPIAVRRPR
jgi:hypothetical protein